MAPALGAGAHKLDVLSAVLGVPTVATAEYRFEHRSHSIHARVAPAGFVETLLESVVVARSSAMLLQQPPPQRTPTTIVCRSAPRGGPTVP